MDRHINFIAQQFKTTDVLYSNLYPYIGLAKLSEALIGNDTVINGLACTETGTPSMSVLIGAGEIYQFADIDTTEYGTLPPDSRQILKQGISLTSITTDELAAPPVAGTSINYLVEFTLSEVDGDAAVIPYYDASNPPVPLNGAGGNGIAQNMLRKDIVSYQIVPGIPAATGTQTTPTPDAGYVGAWVITLDYGDTAITNSKISMYPNAPFMAAYYDGTTLAQLQQSNSEIYAADSSGTPNIVTATLSPALTQYGSGGLLVYILIANTNTGASTVELNGLGAKDIIMNDGTACEGGELVAGQIAKFIYNGSEFQILNPANLTFSGITRINPLVLTSTSSSTYTPTTGMKFIRVRMVGAGGGAGGNKNPGSAYYSAPSGGNSGSYLEFFMTAAQVGASKSYQCGTGGAGGNTATPTNGSAGGNTTFGDWVAAGGKGGIAMTGVVGSSVISTLPAQNSANTIGTGMLLLDIPGSLPNYGVALTVPFGITSLGGNSYLTIYNINGATQQGIIDANIANNIFVSSRAGTGKGNGANANLAINNGSTQGGSVGGNGVILVDEYI